jgi:hypothetical protein
MLAPVVLEVATSPLLVAPAIRLPGVRFPFTADSVQRVRLVWLAWPRLQRALVALPVRCRCAAEMQRQGPPALSRLPQELLELARLVTFSLPQVPAPVVTLVISQLALALQLVLLAKVAVLQSRAATDKALAA